MIKGYKDLEVWQKAMDLVVACYRTTKKFPKNEMYGFASQLRRAAVSVVPGTWPLIPDNCFIIFCARK
jgi:hypothetical protein